MFEDCLCSDYTTVDFTIAATTLVGCVFVVFAMFSWMRRMDDDTALRPFVLSVGIAKAALFVWAALIVVQYFSGVYFHVLMTLARGLMLVAVFVQLWVVNYYRVARQRAYEHERKEG